MVAVVQCAARAARPLTDVEGLRAVPESAGRAELRGREGPVHLGEGATVLDRLVFQHADERGPSRVVHGLGEPGAPETGHREVFHVHRLVVANDLCGCLVVPVPAPVRHLGVLACDLDAGLGPVLRSLGLAGQLPLKALELFLGPAQEARAVDLPAVGQDGESGQPRSIPASVSASGRMSGPVSTTKLRKYRPEPSLVTVTEVGTAGSRRDHLTLRLPTLATYTVPLPWREKALVLRRIDCRVSFFDLYRGGPTLWPCRLPLRLSKKFL